MAYKSKKSGKRNARSGGHAHYNHTGVKQVVKPVEKKED
ncbi:hypothetical protein HNQ37_000818 [Lactovum miscens]|uniref:Uncharacterized protein n=1 Tax=Lactovum miscens TaxID=190387 RepID=A0A841C876_9LACT|nr:hypothetical protein [Lactovum miscens]